MYINSKFIIVNENEKYRVLHRGINRKYDINEDAFNIIRDLTNENNDSEFYFEKKYGNQKEFIYSLINENIIVKTKTGNNEVRVVEMKNGFKRIFMEITKKCNLRCKHCYNESNIKNNEFIGLSEFKTTVLKAKELGVYEVDLTGGEVFTHPNIIQMLEFLEEECMSISVFSNLTMLNQTHFELLKKISIRKFITSLDGYICETHDKFRGVSGAYQKTLDNIKKLKEIGIEVKINVILTKNNIEEINELINFIKTDIKVDYNVSLVLESGRACKELESYGEEIKKYSEILGYIFSNKISSEKCNIADYHQYNFVKERNCGIGNTFLFISANGDICSCPSLTANENKNFVFGNIANDFCFKKIFKDVELILGKLSCEDYSSCKMKEYCTGGCRARAWNQNHRINENDRIMCHMYKIGGNICE